ncbi:hypothetical protein [Actinopolyspora saharensis]|uniref:DUF2267 domain-containing protein n=1 Tax=Actinopolyspora saharensis TaxID=995062 RepID=A0A1H0ZEY4_9ACTN|nr:hypothetical protein [Actinopolyspora saharensis]SDQ25977.1 hypothetical protein SAMN04489718_1005 [Actinopolyspora saharensis]
MSTDSEGAGAVPTVTVGLLSDPGRPTDIARKLSTELPEVLADRVNSEVVWRVRVRSEQVPLDEKGRIPLDEAAEKLPAEQWDLMVCITELPRSDGSRPVVADVDVARGVGLASMPAIGWLRPRAHARNTVAHVVGMISKEKLGSSGSRAVSRSHHHIRRRPTELASPVRQVPSEQENIDLHLALTGTRGRLRLLFGMVRDNRPWRLVPSLSRAIAASAAAAAFGIFYPSIWGMADALSSLRLLGISCFAVAMMAVWIIVHNSLWERPARHGDAKRAAMYNAATLLTLLIGVVCMYVLLFAVTLLAAVAVISASYMEVQLGHSVGLSEYASLVWLASSMGTIAGALGSSLESEAAVRRATYSKREQERRARRRRRERTGQEHEDAD